MDDLSTMLSKHGLSGYMDQNLSQLPVGETGLGQLLRKKYMEEQIEMLGLLARAMTLQRHNPNLQPRQAGQAVLQYEYDTHLNNTLFNRAVDVDQLRMRANNNVMRPGTPYRGLGLKGPGLWM